MKAKPSTVYIADTLPPRYPLLTEALTAALASSGIKTQMLPGTRDIWARDYMPVPTPGQLVQFQYAPDYLRGPRWQHLLTDASAVCQQLRLPAQLSDIVLDGGNVVRNSRTVLMTEKVLRENPQVPAAQLREQLAQLLKTDRLLLLPSDPQDFTGHADGMVYLLDEHTVLVNDYRLEKRAFWPRLRAALQVARLDWVPLTYNPYRNASTTDAAGIYINFLRVQSQLLVPVFDQPEDETALRQLSSLFPSCQVHPIACRELAQEGGLLHCITWTSTS